MSMRRRSEDVPVHVSDSHGAAQRIQEGYAFGSRLTQVLNAHSVPTTAARGNVPAKPTPNAAQPARIDPRNPTSNTQKRQDGKAETMDPFQSGTWKPLMDDMQQGYDQNLAKLKEKRKEERECEQNAQSAADKLLADYKSDSETAIRRLQDELKAKNALVDACQGNTAADKVRVQEYEKNIESLKRDHATALEKLQADHAAAAVAAKEITDLKQKIAKLVAKAKEENAREDTMEKAYQDKIEKLSAKIDGLKSSTDLKTKEMAETFEKICAELKATLVSTTKA